MSYLSSNNQDRFARKLVRLAALSSGTGILIVCTILFFIEYQESRTRIVDQLQVQADIVAANSVAPLMFDDPVAGEETLTALEAAPNVLLACTFDATDTLFACYQKPGVASLSAVPAAGGITADTDMLQIVQPVRLGEQIFGTLVVRKNIRPLVLHQVKRAGIAVLVACFAILFSVVLASSLKRRLVEPLMELLQTAKIVAAEDYSVRARAFSRDEFGELTQAINQMLDRIEERDRRLLEETERAQAAEKAKGSFLSNMSHEIRTPLNGMLGMIGLLMETRTTPQQQDMLQTAQTSGQSMVSVLNDILDLSKFEAGKVQLETIEFDFHLIVAEVLELFAESAQAKGLEIESLIAAEVPQTLHGDGTRIRQVLTNLINNAIKFTSEGHVLVVARYDSENRLTVRIEDTGTGIPQDKLAHIFESFSQADDSVTRRFGGTGLGLALCQRFVALMGGSIGVESTPGVGSQFEIRLPLQAGRFAQQMPSVSGFKHGVLLLNPAPLAERVMCHYLQDWQIPFRVASSVADLPTSHCPYALVVLPCDDYTGANIATLRQHGNIIEHTRFVAIGSQKDFVSAGANYDARLVRPVRRARLLECLLGQEPTRDAKVAGAESADEFEILVVEDNLVNQKVAVGMLKRLRCEVTVAKDGQEALDILAQRSFDLIFMDCQMPVMDGLQATRLIREREQNADRSHPIVAMTAHALEEHRQASLASGMNDHITKPVALADFELMLNKYCADKRRLSGAHGA